MDLDFAYIDTELRRIEEGGDLPLWRHFHWGLFPGGEVFPDGDVADVADRPAERYVRAAEAMTEHIVSVAGVGDGRRVLDVGCGFGGTLDHVRRRNRSCRLVGVNIDERQMQQGRRLLADAGARPPAFATADGCRLPIAGGAFDHVLAIECLFHFPSRRDFFREAARVLVPGGTVALSDFLVAPGRLAEVAAGLERGSQGGGTWYGPASRPLSAAGYERLGRRVGFDLVVDDDVTTATLPTYSVLRWLSSVSDTPGGGIAMVDRFEQLSISGALEYHVLVFRRR